MKEGSRWSKYCTDPSKIEGYERAINDSSDTKYVCHHRWETHFEDGSLRPKELSADLLKYLGYYYNRPAEELIILTAREHSQLHHLAKGNNNYGSKEEAKKVHLEQKKQRQKEHRVDYMKYQKQYYEDHRAQELEQKKQRYDANLEYSRRYSKIRMWIKRNPGSTNIPETWNEEDIKYFNERRQKNGC